MGKPVLRAWQVNAMRLWREAGYRGIVGAVTGGGKTIFALAAIEEYKPRATLIVVPTVALLEQWWGEAAAYFKLGLDDINIVQGKKTKVVSGTVNIVVLNTASKIDKLPERTLLIVDECHKAATESFGTVLELPHQASLGLSATPERQYDDGLSEILVPLIGPVLLNYTYREAMADGVIVPFNLHNLVFDLEAECQQQYDQITKSIARSVSKLGIEAPESIALMLKRARVLNMSTQRVIIALKLIARHSGQKALVFHENIEACDVIHQVLMASGVRAGIYHSKMKSRQRAQMIADYKSSELDVLVTCRALDEGFNVPETQIGIIAASTATRRQRIQRLGRVLRPSSGKEGAIIYTLVATDPEIRRLKEEESEMEGVAEVTWAKA
jgi:superfamily II DNA or RNA helicase